MDLAGADAVIRLSCHNLLITWGAKMRISAYMGYNFLTRQ
jgi:hypothetical protein